MNTQDIKKLLENKSNFPLEVIIDFQYISNEAYQGDQYYHFLLENLPSTIQILLDDDWLLDPNHIRIPINLEFLNRCNNIDCFKHDQYFFVINNMIKNIIPKKRQTSKIKINFE
jgi:hypothetical protein